MAHDVVWVNGSFVDRGEARVSAFDAGFLHGVGLFETMLATRGSTVLLDEHLRRLAESARTLRLSDDLRPGPLAEAVRRTVERSGHAEGDARARVRLTLTGGDLNLLESRAASATDPTVVVSVTRATPYPPEIFERGVGLLVAEPKANPLDPLAGHKTLDYWTRLRSLQQASAAGMGEALWLQVTNHVVGGAVSNVFAVRDGTLLTPLARGEEDPGATPSPVLPGVTRAAVIDLASRIGVGCDTRLLTVADVLDADELFLTNSSWGVLPAVRVEKSTVGSGMPGPITRRLAELWREVETAGPG